MVAPVSANTSSPFFDRTDKLPVYARERVHHAWCVDPTDRTLEILRLAGEQWLIVATHAGDVAVCA